MYAHYAMNQKCLLIRTLLRFIVSKRAIEVQEYHKEDILIVIISPLSIP